MKHFWKRLVACALTVVMLLGMMPPAAYAAVSELVTRSAVENAALLEALRQVYGDDAEAYLAVLEQYGLLDENGNFVTDEKIVMDGVEYTLDEITAILDDPATDLKKVVEVDGQFLTLEDLKTIVEIERYLAYLKATYFTEQDLTDEQIDSFYDLADAWANGEVMLLSSNGLTGVGPAGVDHSVRLTVTGADTATENSTYTVTVTPNKPQTEEITFSWRALSGSVSVTGGGDVTIPAGSTDPVELTVSVGEAANRTKGDTTFLVQLYNLKNALFDNRMTRWQQTVTVAVSDDYCYYYKRSDEYFNVASIARYNDLWHSRDFEGRPEKDEVNPEKVQEIKNGTLLDRTGLTDPFDVTAGEYILEFSGSGYIICTPNFRSGSPIRSYADQMGVSEERYAQFTMKIAVSKDYNGNSIIWDNSGTYGYEAGSFLDKEDQYFDIEGTEIIQATYGCRLMLTTESRGYYLETTDGLATGGYPYLCGAPVCHQ